MKKIISSILVVAMLFCTTLTAAAEAGSCQVIADTVTVGEEGDVTVPVRISGNPGFTNFGIRLDYDREQLELVSIQTGDGENSYLCGTLVSVNTAWEKDGVNYGYITSASAEKITEDGILFSAVFHVKENFAGDAAVTPVVDYMRNYSVQLSVFEELNVTVIAGKVSEDVSVIAGDFNGDGKITLADVMGTLGAYKSSAELTDAQKAAVDTNDDGVVSLAEYMRVLGIYKQS